MTRGLTAPNLKFRVNFSSARSSRPRVSAALSSLCLARRSLDGLRRSLARIQLSFDILRMGSPRLPVEPSAARRRQLVPSLPLPPEGGRPFSPRALILESWPGRLFLGATANPGAPKFEAEVENTSDATQICNLRCDYTLEETTSSHWFEVSIPARFSGIVGQFDTSRGRPGSYPGSSSRS